MISERTPRPVIDEHEWQTGGRLVLRGSFLGPAGDPGTRYETVLRRIGSADSHVIGFTVEGERFRIEADLDRMPFFGSAIPLRDGEWNLYVRPAGTGTEALAELAYDVDRLADVTGQRVQAGRKWYRLMVTGHDQPLITAEPQLRRVEQGNFGQRSLRRGFYPAMLRTAPIRDAVLFISWKGKQCGDNPLGIAEELRRRGDDREHLWAVTDWSVRSRWRYAGAARHAGVLRGPGPVEVPDLQRRHAGPVPQAGRPGLPADLARHPAEEDRLRHLRPAVHQRYRLSTTWPRT